MKEDLVDVGDEKDEGRASKCSTTWELNCLLSIFILTLLTIKKGDGI